MRAATGAPPEARFATRLILRRPDARRIQIWKYRDSDRQIVGSRFDRDVAYDPRERTWFQMAMASDGLIRTDPYAFASTREVGMTVARRFDGPVPGALGVDSPCPACPGFFGSSNRPRRASSCCFAPTAR